MSRSIKPGYEGHVRRKKNPNYHHTGNRTHFHRLAIKQGILPSCLKFLAPTKGQFSEGLEKTSEEDNDNMWVG